MMCYDDLVAEALTQVKEIMPWDLSRRLAMGESPLLLDVREAAEFERLHLPHSLNVPRGVLEQSCEWGYDETVPALAQARDQEIVLICRSGKRSALAALTLLRMGFSQVVSLKTGVRGWNDYEQPLLDEHGHLLDADRVDELLVARVRPEQRQPKN